MKARTLRGSLCPGEDSRPLAASTPQGCRWAIAVATLSPVSPPPGSPAVTSAAPRLGASRRPRPSRGWRGRSGWCPGYEPASSMRRELAAKPLITKRTVAAICATSSGPSWPCSCAAPRPAWPTMSTTPAGEVVAKHPDGQHLRRQPTHDRLDRRGADLARRGGEDEADRVRAHRDGEQRILLGGDATDLHEHPRPGHPRPAAVSSGVPGPTPRRFSRAAPRSAARRAPRRRARH